MKLYIIRHAKVDMKMPVICNSKEYAEFTINYNKAGIVPVTKNYNHLNPDMLFVSTLSRSQETASGLFPGREQSILESAVEVPICPFAKVKGRIFLWMFSAMGRIQWYRNNNTQPEVRSASYERADALIKQLEEQVKDKSAALVTHGFFMKVLVSCLKKQGYQITGNRYIDIKNLQVITAEKE